VESLSVEQWKNGLENDSYILNCILDESILLDHKYRDAFEEHFLNVMDTGEADGWLWTKFDGILSKAIDNDILKKNLSNKYFSVKTDKLNDDAFNAVASHFLM